MRSPWVWFAIILGVSPGCSEFRDYADNSMVASRNDYLARTSWRAARHHFCHVDFLEDFGKGYRAGYAAIASGGSGCPPILPPKEYWSVCYQNPAGYSQAQAWFDGFHQGVIAAERDGVANFTQIPTWCTGNECEDRERAEDKELREREAQEAEADLPPAEDDAPAEGVQPLEGVSPPTSRGGEYLPAEEPPPPASSFDSSALPIFAPAVPVAAPYQPTPEPVAEAMSPAPPALRRSLRPSSSQDSVERVGLQGGFAPTR